MDGIVRTEVGAPFTVPLTQNGGAVRAAPDDYSIYGTMYTFLPFAEVGTHDLQCFAIASASGFDPNPITATALSARYTGSQLGDLSVV